MRQSMKSNKILLFIYELINKGGKIWVHNGNLKVAVPEGYFIDSDQTNFLKENKSKIIDCLVENNLYSGDYEDIILRNEIHDAPLSFGQERLWFVEQYENGTNAYIVPTFLKILPQTDIGCLIDSIRAIVSRHEVLRTIIERSEDGGTYQKVIDDSTRPLVIRNEVVSDINELEEKLKIEVNGIFNLEYDYPVRVCLFKLIDKKSTIENSLHYLSFITHHIAFDGWSADIFLKELHEFYKYYRSQKNNINYELQLPKMHIQYKDFALWQRCSLQNNRLDKLLAFWKEELLDFEELRLLSDYVRPKQFNYRGQEQTFEVDEEVSQSLRAFAKHLGISLYSLLLTGYALMLRCYSGQDDIIIGTPMANRHNPSVEHLIGFFINALPVRIKIDSSQSINELIKNVGKKTTILQSYQDLPFEKLVHALDLEKDTGKHPLFQTMFGVQSFTNEWNEYHEPQDPFKIAAMYAPKENIYNIARFDITTFINDSSQRLLGSFNYSDQLYKSDTINSFIETYQSILRQFADIYENNKQEQYYISNFNYINKSAFLETIDKWNDTKQNYSLDKLVHDLFEDVAYNMPNKTAVKFRDQFLTYGELKVKSDILAAEIASICEENDIIALCIDRSEKMIISLLAILKAGCAYLPIDPSIPDSRIQTIIQDCIPKMILTESHYKKRFVCFDGNILLVDQFQYNNTYTVQPNKKAHPDDMIYLIYTSGSTGVPKGVMVSHKSIINVLCDMLKRFDIRQADCLVSTTSIAFDISFLEIFLPLITGAELVIVPQEVITSPAGVLQIMSDSACTIMQATPSAWRMLINTESTLKIDNKIKILCGGEPIGDDISNFFIQNGNKIYNLYGPTETTIWSCANLITSSSKSSEIGRPILNTKIYVLNADLKLLPIRAVGEICIAGDGLSMGYLKRQDLTNEKFIDYTLPDGSLTKIYKTGDLGSWSHDGTIQYLGRNDFQIKIRGYRIELGDIENHLIKHVKISQAAVIAYKVTNDDIRLVAHLIPSLDLASKDISEDALISLDIEDVKAYLTEFLPHYMLPHHYIVHDNFKLNSNGKLDRKWLEEQTKIALMTRNITKSKVDFVAPQSSIEKKMCKIWSNILGMQEDKISLNDDFFSLGGHSILAIKLINQMNNNLDASLALSDLFAYRTPKLLVKRMEDYLSNSNNLKQLIFKHTNESHASFPLSFAQERLYFIQRYENGTNAYNIPMVYKINSHVDKDILEDTIRSIVSRHEILRTLLKEDIEGKIHQAVVNCSKHPLEIRKVSVDNKDALDMEILNEINQIFNLSSEYPIRVCLYELRNTICHTDLNNLSNSQCYISIVVHHAAFDEWSADILLREIQEYYEYYLELKSGKSEICGIHNKKLNLPNLTIQYKDFTIWQRSYISGEVLEKQLGYWKQKLLGYETLNLVTDYQRPRSIDYRGGEVRFELESEISKNLRAVAKTLKVSLYSVLLAGYYLMLKVYSNQNDIVVGIPIANRHYPQVEDLIGLFVNTLALRIQIDSNLSIKEFIERIGCEVVAAQLNQDIPFEQLVSELAARNDTSRNPIFQVIFQMANFDNYSSSLDGLLDPYVGEYDEFKIAKFDLSAFIDDGMDKLRGCFNYSVSLYKEETIHGFVETFVKILEQFAGLIANETNSTTQTTLEDLEYLPKTRETLVLGDWNDTDIDYPRNKTIHQMFEEQVVKTPDNLAVLYEDTMLTYRELNERANRLANFLVINYGLKPDTLVALLLDRSEYMIIAILAILKAGGAYVPIDPSYPDERIGYILRDTATSVVLTNNQYQQKLNNIKCLDDTINKVNILPIDDTHLQNQISLKSCANLGTKITGNNIAYVIYTSGTTGNPKGVMIEHHSVINRIIWMNNTYHLKASDKILQKTPYVFDVSIWELLWANWYGATIVIAKPEGHKDGDYIAQLIGNQDISIIHFVPSMLTAFEDVVKINKMILPSLRYIFCSGEALATSQVKVCHEILPHTQIHNLYGPTEATVDVLFYDCNANNLEKVCIGKPIHNTKAYILSDNLKPLPIGAIGELYIGGVGLARGYLNQPELTAEKFILNPFQTEEESRDIDYGKKGRNSRLYKTGDLARWMPDGNIEYIGRNDSQVKIRGYRIELGEIESVLSSYKDVKQSVVLAKERIDNNNTQLASKCLIGYYVSKKKLIEEDILRYLKAKLPDYMIPSILVHLKELPITINGKLDRSALHAPEFIKENVNYIAPRNQIEENMLKIWANILGIREDKISVHDDFFFLGGDSIFVIRLAAQIKQTFGIDISLRIIFHSSSIRTMSCFIEQQLSINNT